MILSWIKPESQRTLLKEDIWIYSIILYFNLTYDFFYNALLASGVLYSPAEPEGHLINIGIQQLGVAVFCIIQLIRKFGQLRWLA